MAVWCLLYFLLSPLSCSIEKDRLYRRSFLLGDTGLEPSGVTNSNDKGLQNTPNRGGAFSGAESGVLGDIDLSAGRLDADLRKVIDAWPTLPQAVRKDIAATIETHATRGAK